MTEKNRSQKRRRLVYYLEVYDDEVDELLGHLVDLTSTGLKLMSRRQISPNRTYRLRMMLPKGYFSQKGLSFEAQSMWSSNEISPDFYDTGFSAPELEDVAKDISPDLVIQITTKD